MVYRKWILRLSCLMLLSFLPTIDGVSAETGHGAGALVRVDGQQLSINAFHASLETVLIEIGRQSGIEIFYQGRPGGSVTLDLQRIDLETGVKRLIGSQNHAFIYGYDDRNRVTIKQLYIYADTGQGAMQRIVSAKAIPAVRRPGPAEADSGIVVHAQTPSDRDPLVSMQAIDPLMKINGADAPHLPEGFHGDHPVPDERAMPHLGGPTPRAHGSK